MDEKIGGLEFLTLRFDDAGDIDPQGEATVLEALKAGDVRVLVVFSPGWHNTPSAAARLSRAFFGRLAPLLLPPAPDGKVLLRGIVGPARAWSDEPIPD